MPSPPIQRTENDIEFIRSLLRGYSDYKAGRMRPGSEVKDELGIR